MWVAKVNLMRVILGVVPTLLLVSSAYAINSGIDLAHLEGWDIIVAKNAIPGEQYAAMELQEFLEQSTGAHLKITHAVSAEASPHRFYVGGSATADAVISSLKTDRFGAEDFRIAIDDNAVVIVG